MLKIKLPSESSRQIRSLTERAYFKANELRNLAFYIAFPLFYGILNDKYLKNLLKYLIFLRILTQEAISVEEINDSKLLIDEFLKEYETLYGTDSMTYNAHAHQHLTMQVLRHGPINKISCFPFENMFKSSRDLFHGTRNFEGQIAFNLEKRKNIRLNLDKLLLNTKNKDIYGFVWTYFKTNKNYENQRIINMKETTVDCLKVNEQEILKTNRIASRKVIYGNQAWINKKSELLVKLNLNMMMNFTIYLTFLEFNTYNYDLRLKTCNSLIKYGNNKYGIIYNFFILESFYFLFVKKYCVCDVRCLDLNLDKLCEKYLFKYYPLVHETNDYELVKFSEHINKVIKIEIENKFFLSECSYDECD